MPRNPNTSPLAYMYLQCLVITLPARSIPRAVVSPPEPSTSLRRPADNTALLADIMPAAEMWCQCGMRQHFHFVTFDNQISSSLRWSLNMRTEGHGQCGTVSKLRSIQDTM